MARKRMISPEIWESQNFSALSDLGKIVFISLFSHADDEGRGRADPTYIKSSTFPYDKDRRVADIEFALSEIARSMSVQFYSVNGIEFYFMKSWKRWQKIDKPSKSKLPPPPSVGEGGAIHSSGKFDEYSGSVRGTLGEASPTNRIEKNRIPPISPQGEGGGERSAKSVFMSAYPLLAAAKKYDDSKIDYALLKTMFDRSERLKATYSMKWVCDNYDTIINGAFTDKDFAQKEAAHRELWYSERRQTAEDKADKAMLKARRIPGFEENEARLNTLVVRCAFAETTRTGDSVDCAELQMLEKCKERRIAMLATIGLTDDDLKVHYHCTKCNDTGYNLETGHACDCYRGTI